MKAACFGAECCCSAWWRSIQWPSSLRCKLQLNHLGKFLPYLDQIWRAQNRHCTQFCFTGQLQRPALSVPYSAGPFPGTGGSGWLCILNLYICFRVVSLERIDTRAPENRWVLKQLPNSFLVKVGRLDLSVYCSASVCRRFFFPLLCKLHGLYALTRLYKWLRE